MTTIDHAAEARKHLEDVESYANDAHSFRFNDEEGRAIQALSHGGLSAQLAQAHATLALVEAQRIANVLAYLDHAEGDQYERLHDDIKKALELS